MTVGVLLYLLWNNIGQLVMSTGWRSGMIIAAKYIHNPANTVSTYMGTSLGLTICAMNNIYIYIHHFNTPKHFHCQYSPLPLCGVCILYVIRAVVSVDGIVILQHATGRFCVLSLNVSGNYIMHPPSPIPSPPSLPHKPIEYLALTCNALE